MTDKELLQSALPKSFADRLPDTDGELHSFSSRYRKRQDRILGSIEKPHRRLRSAVIIAAAAVMGVLMVTAFVRGYSFGGFTVVMHGENAEIVEMNIRKSTVTETSRFYCPDALPFYGGPCDYGYRYIYSVNDKALYISQYTASAAKGIVIKAQPQAAAAVNGFYVNEHHRCTLYWEQSGYLMSVGGNFSKQELEAFSRQIVFY